LDGERQGGRLLAQVVSVEPLTLLRRGPDEPDEMRPLLVEHDAILRDVIDKHRGHLSRGGHLLRMSRNFDL
jgi:hypothetical protein